MNNTYKQSANKPSFFEGVGVALVASISIAASVHLVTQLFFGTGMLLVTLSSFAYLIYLLWRSPERTGRVTAIAAWVVLSILAWVFSPSLLVYSLIQLGMIWLTRSLYYYNSVLVALADMALTGLSVAIAVWAWSSSHSLFLSLWCFFLTQALLALLPPELPPKMSKNSAFGKQSLGNEAERFEQAHQAAEQAVRKLSTHSC